MEKIDIRVVGVTFEDRQNILRKLYQYKDNLIVWLKRDENNIYDPNAIAVFIKDPHNLFIIYRVGYIPKLISKEIRELLNEGLIISIKIKEFGKYNGKYYLTITLKIKV